MWSFRPTQSVVAGNRRRNIDATLPYAINYITSMSTAGITPAEIFRLLGDSPIYGESAVEARYIAREIDIFGKDLIDALRIVSASTPSHRMKEFLQGAMASISSGGNLTDYFRTKANQYALENRQTQKLFLDTLAAHRRSLCNRNGSRDAVSDHPPVHHVRPGRRFQAHLSLHHHLYDDPLWHVDVYHYDQFHDPGDLIWRSKIRFTGLLGQKKDCKAPPRSALVPCRDGHRRKTSLSPFPPDLSPNGKAARGWAGSSSTRSAS